MIFPGVMFLCFSVYFIHFQRVRTLKALVPSNQVSIKIATNSRHQVWLIFITASRSIYRESQQFLA